MGAHLNGAQTAMLAFTAMVDTVAHAAFNAGIGCLVLVHRWFLLKKIDWEYSQRYCVS